jgi:glycine cleavage system H protein
MDGYSYINIFETKGIEYIIIIAFLVLIIPFWIIINRQTELERQVKKVFGILTAGILRIPKGLFYSRNHTWIHLERSGIASMGLDDFLLHITGEIKLDKIKNKGDLVSKGELLAEIVQKGKILKITSPVSGKIVNINSRIKYDPSILNEDPYGKGWIYKIYPSNWIEETSSCFLAEEAIAWSGRELARFKDFLAAAMNKYSPEASMLVLQDGGELCDRPLSELPDQIWLDFQKSFLN